MANEISPFIDVSTQIANMGKKNEALQAKISNMGDKTKPEDLIMIQHLASELNNIISLLTNILKQLAEMVKGISGNMR